MRHFARFFNRLLTDSKFKITFFIILILACIVAASIGIYIQFFYKYAESDPLMIGINIGSKKTAEYYSALKAEFNDIFNNELVSENPNIRFDRLQTNKDIVYTGYDLKNEDENYYEVNVKIPILNINSDEAKRINDEIKSEFYDKANVIMRQNEEYTVYTVNYEAFVNEDIVSIVIKSSLKEEGQNEKLSIKTFNYNVPGKTSISLEQLIELKQTTKSEIQNTINSEIKKAYNNALAIAEQYGSSYTRDLNDNMYKIENTTEYFLTNEGNVYILYPYGNKEYTNELDIIIF